MVRNTLLLLLCSFNLLVPATAEEIDLILDGQLDCATQNYCVSIQLQSVNKELSIGTSSIFLKYNKEALSFLEYTSKQFDGSSQCIQDVASAWDIQTYDATSAPGFFNLTMTLVSNDFSCPKVHKEAVEVGIICFDIVDEKKNPGIKALNNNTSFNSSDPNTGANLIGVKNTTTINGPKELQCETEDLSDCASKKELWEETEIVLMIENCEELANFCTGVPYNNAKVYDFEINEISTEDIDRCETGETSFFYTYSSLLKLEKEGDFEVADWTVEGVSHSGTFSNTNELIELLGKWDAKGEWSIDEKMNTISGGDSEQSYGAIKIKNLTSDLSILMGLNKKVSAAAASLLLPEGTHQIRATNHYTKCEDRIAVKVICAEPVVSAEERVDQQIDRLLVTASDTLWCLDHLIAADDFIENCTEVEGQHSEIRIDNQTHCMSVLANTDGTDVYCLFVCDQEDNCRTLELEIRIEESHNPNLRDDFVTVMMNNNSIIQVRDNDVINGDILEFGVPPIQQMDGTIDVAHDDVQIIYTPPYEVCGVQDSFQYFIANHKGKGVATVKVDILCEELTVFSGFSPNGDGINDYFKILGIENFEESEVYIFNSRGNEVYSKRGYRNEDGWDGTWKGRNLPDGTYFYMVSVGEGRQPTSGYVQVQR